MNYLLAWAHQYPIHFGAWMTFSIGMTVFRNGLPELKTLPKLMGAAALLSAVMSIFSSHSVAMYLNQAEKLLK